MSANHITYKLLAKTGRSSACAKLQDMSTDDEHMEGGCIVYAADAHEDSDNDVFFSADEDVAVEEHQAVACKSVSKSKPKTVSEKYKKAVDNEVASSATSSGGILSDDCGMGSGNTDDDDDDALPHVIFDTSKMARERGQPLQLEFEELTTIRTAHDETGAAAESMVRAGPVIPLSMAITHPEIPRSTMPNNNETYGSDGTVHDIANESNDCVSNNSNSDDEAARLFGALCLEDLPTFDLTGVDDDVCKHVMNDDDADDEEEALIRWTRRPRAQARIVVESESDEEDDAGAKNNNVLYVKKTYGTVIALDEDFEDGDDNELESVGISGDKNSAAPPLLAADEPWLSDDDCAVVNATPVHITKPGPAVIFTP